MQRLLVILLICGMAFSSIAQPTESDTRAVWLRTINAKAIAPKMGGGKYAAAKPGFALYFNSTGGVVAPYVVYVPKSYDPTRPAPMVVFLHGAILARDSFQYKEPSIAIEPIFQVADTYNAIVVFPFGRADFMWPTQPAALENVEAIIGQVKQHYNIAAGKTYLGGISMGGIATFWFITHKPELCSGYYTFSAMPRLRDGDVNFANITTTRPVYSVHAVDDPGFKFSEVQSIYDQNKAAAPGWHFSSVPSGGHRFIYGRGGREIVKRVVGSVLGNSF